MKTANNYRKERKAKRSISVSGLTNLTKLYIMSNSITTGVASLTNLTNATIINFFANIDSSLYPTIPCSDLTTLDSTLDSSNGMETGIVQWDDCAP